MPKLFSPHVTPLSGSKERRVNHRRKILQKLKHILHSDKLHQFFSPVAHAENPFDLQNEIESNELLGRTNDGMLIVLCSDLTSQSSALLREIGRLREYTFRKVGEGSGKKRDLDVYDELYQHLILWDVKNTCLVGAYRLGNASKILKRQGVEGLYTHSLYRFNKPFLPILSAGLELGRSFVHPAYWGKSSLDYLWQGIGAYINHHPEIRYMFGPISMSARYPTKLIAELSYFFLKYYPATDDYTTARTPYTLDKKLKSAFDKRYKELPLKLAMSELQKSFAKHKLKIPVLFKQYATLFDSNGFQTLGFSVDFDFGDCLDGFCMADLNLLKANKRKRYIAKTCSLSVPRCSAAHDPAKTAHTRYLRPGG